MLPAVIPFNLAKGALNAVLTVIVYKAVSNLIAPEKAPAKGSAPEKASAKAQ